MKAKADYTPIIRPRWCVREIMTINVRTIGEGQKRALQRGAATWHRTNQSFQEQTNQ